VARGLFLTPRLSRDQLREAIELPARVFGCQVAPELVNRLLNELGDQQDQLPVLAHALLAMWRLASQDTAGQEITPLPSGVISIPHYNAIGGLQKGIAHSASPWLFSMRPTPRNGRRKTTGAC